MARIRSIKPEFFTDADTCELSPLHRLLFAGLWCQADRSGRLEDKPKELKVKILPYDNCDIDSMLSDLVRAKGGRGFIRRYVAGGKRLIECLNFEKHQHCHRDEKASVLAPCEHGAATVLAPVEHGANTPISCLLSLGSGLLAPVVSEVASQTSAPVERGVIASDHILAPCPAATSEKHRESGARKARKGDRIPDPRHAPMVKALVDACAGYAFVPRDAKAVSDLLALGTDAEILTRWRRALQRSTFPLVRSLSELSTHWNHFATDAPPKDIRKGVVQAEDIVWGKPRAGPDPF